MAQIDHDQAVTMALQAVQFIFEHDDLRDGFLNMSGVSPDSIKERIENDDFLAGILDYLLEREEALVLFCEENSIDPTLPQQAQISLSMF